MNIFSRNAGNLPARGSSKGGGSSRRAQLQTGTTVLLATSAAVATLWPAAIGRCPATHGSCSLSSAACMSACQPGPGMCINNTHCDVQHALRCRHGARDAQSVAIVYGEVDLNAEERELLTSKWCQLRSTARVH